MSNAKKKFANGWLEKILNSPPNHFSKDNTIIFSSDFDQG